MTHLNELRDRIETRRLMIALTGEFDVNSRPFNQAFCRCLAMDVEDQPDDVVPFERTVSRIRAMLGRLLNGPDQNIQLRDKNRRLRDKIAGHISHRI